MKELYLVGKILKAKGLKGEMKVLPITDYPESFLDRKVFYIGKNEGDAVRQVVRQGTLRKGFAYLLFFGIDTREKAEAVAGEKVYVSVDDLIPLPHDRAYLHELKGLKVLNESFEEVGVVLDVLKMPAHEVYEVQCGEQVVLVPAVEEFVEEIVIEKGYMVLKRLEEFL
ncbi:ribosome maturation factor RimM [Prosthecochloris sp. SCSIO W1103]|uniref:ribosome maturation factor RimM n=1 Tax=Prosthecochloris sp. SCSIO W1103 TaxID=2992244 RepID=UPI00223DB5F5|nr:ribosome maturation factor RimM [Prosthecochloris sp. SCSIO W1103]UZJ38633.1 ribosome maturation factor RimM [Prosthecochloris sp. SCSIO W1103]